MRLADNPIFLTQKRLAHRAGIAAPLAIGFLVGLCLLAGFLYHRFPPPQVWGQQPPVVGRIFYSWLLGFQAAVLLLGGFSHISKTVVDERRAGLFDANRLTPLSPAQLVLGYWLGAARREWYIALAVAPLGLVMVALAGLPVSLWLGTQALLFTSALLVGLAAVVAGMAMARPQGGAASFLGLIVCWPLAFLGAWSITNFIVPIHATLQLFGFDSLASERMFGQAPHLLGLAVPSLLYTWGLQVVLGWVLWQAAVRKVANPATPALSRLYAVALFAFLLLLQHGLVWTQCQDTIRRHANFDDVPALAILHAGTLLFGLLLLGAAPLAPEQARRTLLRTGASPWRQILARSCVPIGFALAAIATAAILLETGGHLHDPWMRTATLAAVLNLVAVFLSACLLIEVCLLSFRRRAVGFMALGFVVLYALPFALAAAFQQAELTFFSFLTPGIAALAGPSLDNLRPLVIRSSAFHLAITAVVAYFWWDRWQALIRAALPPPPGPSAPPSV